jgi:hypothetical protein
MTRDPNLDAPRLPGKKDQRVRHDWRPPAAHAVERTIEHLNGSWKLRAMSWRPIFTTPPSASGARIILTRQTILYRPFFPLTM